MATQLVWFRNDLRITDNSALSAACRCADDKVIALFVATPEQWKNHLHHQLRGMAQQRWWW